MSRSKRNRNRDKRNQQNKTVYLPDPRFTYEIYEFEDPKTKKKKRFSIRLTKPEEVNSLANSIFGSRYYTLSQDPNFVKD